MPKPLAPPAMKRADDLFFTAIACFMLALVVTGFAPSYFLRGAVFARLPSVLVHLHGAVFSAWIILFPIQSSLIAANNYRLHRKLGWLGAVLAGLMVILGILAPIGTLRRHAELPSFFTPTSFLIDNILGILIFGAFVAVAVWKRNNRKLHKRVLLVANVMLLPPALSRIPYVQHHFFLVPVTLFSILGALIVFDLFTWRRPLLVTIVCVVLFLASNPLMSAAEHTAMAARMVAWAQHNP